MSTKSMGLNVRTSSDRTISGQSPNATACGERAAPDSRTSFADSASSYTKRVLKLPEYGDAASPSLTSKSSTPVNVAGDVACSSPGSANKKAKGGLLYVSFDDWQSGVRQDSPVPRGARLICSVPTCVPVVSCESPRELQQFPEPCHRPSRPAPAGHTFSSNLSGRMHFTC